MVERVDPEPRRCGVCGTRLSRTEPGHEDACWRRSFGLMVPSQMTIPPDAAWQLERRSIGEPNSGCRLWLGSLDEDGLPYLVIRRKVFRARRLMWRVERGEIPPTFLVCNRCGVRACVEASHHELGQYKDMHRLIAQRGNTSRGERNGVAVLTAEAVRLIRSSTDRQVDLAARFGVGQTAVAAANTGQNWRHIR